LLVIETPNHGPTNMVQTEVSIPRKVNLNLHLNWRKYQGGITHGNKGPCPKEKRLNVRNTHNMSPEFRGTVIQTRDKPHNSSFRGP